MMAALRCAREGCGHPYDAHEDVGGTPMAPTLEPGEWCGSCDCPAFVDPRDADGD